MFQGLRDDQVAAFIMARQAAVEPQYPSISSLPKKGTADLAREKVDCKILVAFKCKHKHNTLRERFPFTLAPEENQVNCDSESPITHVALFRDVVVIVQPSELLSNVDWVTNVIELFDLDGTWPSISEEDKQKADELGRVLRHRYHIHVKRRVMDENKRTHWSLKLAYKNLSVCAAVMILSDHVKEDLRFLGDSSCLLAIPRFFVQCRSVPTKEGAYLYFDTNRFCFIRSGKVARRGFEVRGLEHFKESKQPTSSSNFYLLYPSVESERRSAAPAKGNFEKLDHLVAAGFVPSSTQAQSMNKDWTEGGLLILSDEDKSKIRDAPAYKKLTEMQKFQDICAYQMEFGYDLAISLENNVSRNPGFESVLGVIVGNS